MAKSVSLTMDDRRQILRGFLAASRSSEAETLFKDQEFELALELRDYTLGKDKDAYLNLPEKLQEKDSSIMVLNLDRFRVHDFKFEDREPCPIGRIDFGDLPKKLQSKLIKFLTAKEKANSKIDALQRDLNGVLQGVNTTKQLLELLPEAEEHFPLTLKTKMQSAGLPALPAQFVSNLRARLKP